MCSTNTQAQKIYFCLFSVFVQTYSSSFGCSCCCCSSVYYSSYWRTDWIRNFTIEPGMESFMEIVAWIFEMIQHKLIPPKTINSQDYKGFCLHTKFLLRADIQCVALNAQQWYLLAAVVVATTLFRICAFWKLIITSSWTDVVSISIYLALTPPSSTSISYNLSSYLNILLNIFGHLNVCMCACMRECVFHKVMDISINII